MCLVCLPASQCLCALVPGHDATVGWSRHRAVRAAASHYHVHDYYLQATQHVQFNVDVGQQCDAAEERLSSVIRQIQCRPRRLNQFSSAQHKINYLEPFHDKSHGRVRRPRNLNPDRLAARAPIFHLQMQRTLRPPGLSPSNSHQHRHRGRAFKSRADRPATSALPHLGDSIQKPQPH